MHHLPATNFDCLHTSLCSDWFDSGTTCHFAQTGESALMRQGSALERDKQRVCGTCRMLSMMNSGPAGSVAMTGTRSGAKLEFRAIACTWSSQRNIHESDLSGRSTT